jgi:branched-chain amino acid aminotransferase
MALDTEKTNLIWFNGELVDWEKATIHVLSHVIHYGSSVFEGLRCYETSRGPAIFRLEDHTRRLFDSAKIYRMPIPFTPEQINEACKEVVRANKLQSAYLRPVAFRGYGALGVNPAACPVQVAVAALNWGRYLGEEALEQGVDVCVASWARLAPNTLPSMSKAGGNYLNSQLVKMEALQDGYAEGIVLGTDGYVAEGSGENIFLIRNGRVITPPMASSILPGITRHTAVTLLREQGVEVIEERIPREALYLADEIFFTGTAAEVTPIRSVDRITIGAGRRGPITEQVQSAFFGILRGEVEDRFGWLAHV